MNAQILFVIFLGVCYSAKAIGEGELLLENKEKFEDNADADDHELMLMQQEERDHTNEGTPPTSIKEDKAYQETKNQQQENDDDDNDITTDEAEEQEEVDMEDLQANIQEENEAEEQEEVDMQDLQANIQEGMTVKVQWNTRYRRYFHLYCGNRRAIYWVRSKHCNRYEDRVWYFNCKRVSCYNFNRCYWTHYNRYDRVLHKRCRWNYVMSGIRSRYSRRHRDRKFSLLCCRAPRYRTRYCHWSGYVNRWDGRMSYHVSGNRAFTGMFSYHSNRHEDRRWRIRSCQYRRY